MTGAPAERPEDGDDLDDARHVTWDYGRRTLCGKQMADDPGDFYLPLGKAPRTDEGGAWCWSCLRLQDEAATVLTAAPAPGKGEKK